MTKVVKLVGLYVLVTATVAGCFTLMGLGKASWAEVGPLVAAIVLGMAGIHASSITGGTQVSASPTTPASASGEATPAGVGSAGHAG
ncbi:MAG: hypothetical protein ACYCSJ_01450 [Acidimicrobiales bacterium]